MAEKNYSRWHKETLPADDTNLDHSFTEQEYTDVATEDDVRVNQEFE